MPMVTTNNNEGQFLPIFIYAQNIYKDGEWGGDAEISMVSLIYNDIRVGIYRLIINTQSNEILGYECINTYGDINDNITSILILININNNHWVLGYYNRDNGAQINNFIIPTISLNNGLSKLINNKNKKAINYKLDSELSLIKKEYTIFILTKHRT